jgi:hypothetical protein
MAVPANKVQLLDAMQQGFAKLETELSTIDPGEAQYPGMEGHARGTTMSVNDLVAYLDGWGQLVLKWVELRDRGLEPDFPETGYKWNELGALAQKFYRDQQGLDFADCLDKLRATHARLVALVERLDNDALYGHGWYDRWTLGRMIQFNTASPYANARARIRKWKKAKAAV